MLLVLRRDPSGTVGPLFPIRGVEPDMSPKCPMHLCRAVAPPRCPTPRLGRLKLQNFQGEASLVHALHGRQLVD
jgi:hypothetical protein